MPHPAPGADRKAIGLFGALGTLALVLGTSIVWYPPISSGGPGCTGIGPTDPRILDGSPTIRTTFGSGGVQILGANTTTVLIGGVGSYHRVGGVYATTPALEAWPLDGGTPQDLTARVAPFFPAGGLYPVVWNGSAWLIGGQRNSTGASGPSLVFLEGSRTTDRSADVAPYFQGGWIWTAGWDGTGWLIAGSSSSGAAAVYLVGERLVDLSPEIPHNRAGDWVQWVGWNGTGWLLGGGGVLSAYVPSAPMVDLYPASPFSGGGVYGGDWNGSRWLVGGSPASIAFIDGDAITVGPPLPSGTSGWINAVVAYPGGWLVGGGVVLGPDQVRPLLDRVSSGPSPAVRDLSGQLPAEFAGGWIQDGRWVERAPSALLLFGGVGGADPVEGPGAGALAEVSWSCPPIG